MPRLLAACSALLLIAAARGALADDPQADEVTADDVQAFGRLPARFNGRLTTFDAYARNVVQHVSGREDVLDATGETLSPTRWLLDLITEEEDALQARLFPVPNAQLRDRLDLPDRKPDENGRVWYTPDELPMQRIQTERERLQDVSPRDRTASDEALLHLADRIQHVLVLNVSLSSPLRPGRSAEQVVSVLRRIEGHPLLRPVPTTRVTPWEPLARSRLMRTIRPRETPPAAEAFFATLEAYQKGNAERFREAVQEYPQVLEKHGFDDSPLDFDVPDGWFELGLAYDKQPAWYSDALQQARHAVSLEIGRGHELVGLDVNVFDAPVAPAERFLDEWRINHSRAPLPRDSAKKLLRPLEVDGFRGHLLDVVTPDEAPADTQRSLGAILVRGPHTVLVTMNGAAQRVAPHVETFESFVRSLRFGSQNELREWLGPVQPVPTKREAAFRQILAFVPDGDAVWVLEFVEPADGQASRRDAFFERLASIRIEDAETPADRLEFEPPEAWRPVEDAGAFARFDASPTEENPVPARILVEWLQLAENQDVVLPLVNHRREGFRSPRFDAEQLARRTQRRTIDGRTVRIVEFETSAASTADGDE